MVGSHLGAERAQWLSELSDTLDDAARVLVELGLATRSNASAMELYLRIERARFAVKSLGLKRSAVLFPPIWIKSSPWGTKLD